MPNGTRITKDQQRASRAYDQVGVLWDAYNCLPRDDKDARQKAKEACENYEIAVKALGANILRSGLSAALADIMRRKERAQKLREHIAVSQIPGLVGVNETDLFARVNGLEVGAYMLATRETLHVVTWLKRACDALFEFKNHGETDSASIAVGTDGGAHA